MIGMTEVAILAVIGVFFFGRKQMKQWIQDFHEMKKELTTPAKEEIKTV